MNSRNPLRGQEVGTGTSMKLEKNHANMLEQYPTKTGYPIMAREIPFGSTTQRFKTISGSPETYQYSDYQIWFKAQSWGCIPFGSSTQRFQSMRGPQNSRFYALDTVRNSKVSWPMCFGSPDFSRLPQLEAVKLMLPDIFCDKHKALDDNDNKKWRNRIAYFNLYYS